MNPAPLQPTEMRDLLRHEEWLRGLLRRLVADQDIDDLLQETYLGALQVRTPPRRPRTWLAGIARNLAHLGLRRRRRREIRELRSARGERLPSTAEVLQRFELQRRVTRFVCELEEPCRSAIVDRFYHGLSAREIAKRCATSEANVRQRIKRGLDRLRARMAGDTSCDWHKSAPVLLLACPRRISIRATIAVGFSLACAALVCILAWMASWSSADHEALALGEQPRALPPNGIAASAPSVVHRSVPTAVAPEDEEPEYHHYRRLLGPDGKPWSDWSEYDPDDVLPVEASPAVGFIELGPLTDSVRPRIGIPLSLAERTRWTMTYETRRVPEGERPDAACARRGFCGATKIRSFYTLRNRK